MKTSLSILMVMAAALSTNAHDDHHVQTAAPLPQLDARGWVQTGDLLMQRLRESPHAGLDERAAQAYRSALAQDEKNADAMVGLAWVYNSRHEFAQGRSWAEKALAINPGLSHAEALLGDGAVELGDYEAGLEHYQKALDLTPNLSSYSRAAHVVWLRGDVRKARWLMQKAIAAGGNYPENVAWCRAELALIDWHDGALYAAEKQAELAFKSAPRNAHVLAILARIKAAKKEYDKAIELYREAVEIAPSHGSLVALGDLYHLLGRRDDAEKIDDRVIAFHSAAAEHEHHSHVHSHPNNMGNAELARFYADRNLNLDEAIHEAELAYQTYKNVFVADTLAWCYYKRGNYPKARAVSDEALRWRTPDASLFFHAGMIHSKLGNSNKAREFLNRALNLNPHFHARDAAQAREVLQELSRGSGQGGQKESRNVLSQSITQ